MAQAMICDGCGLLPATVLITNIENGDVMAFDVPCSALWAETHAMAVAEAMGADYPGQAGKWLSLAQGATGAASEPTDTPATDSPAKPKRARRPRQAAPEFDPDRTIGEIIETGPRESGADDQGGNDDGGLRGSDSGLPAGSAPGPGGRGSGEGRADDAPPF